MSKSALLTVLMFGFIVSFGQNISVTFTGTGAAIQIASVTATNLRTNQSITLPGNETLVLSINSGISSTCELNNMGMAFPNPFTGKATFTTDIQNPQTVYLKVLNLFGQIVAQTTAIVRPGENEFILSVNTAGIYMISLTTRQGTTSYKVICTDATETENRIQYNGSASGYDRNPTQSGLKSSQTGYSLGYTIGDVVLFRCRSGIFTTIIADSPAVSKNYVVEFVACTDPDGKSYSIVKIGTQTWMIENLAYLPSVSQSSTGSNTSPYYYVYGYEGTSVSAAKTSTNFTTYGVLYNWEAAKTACPNGWHLPNDAEWNILTDYLTNNGYGYRGSGIDIGKSMAATSGWTSLLWAGTIGNDQTTNNRSGFTALPGGYRNYAGGFYDLGDYATFWSSSGNESSNAWYRGLLYSADGVYRVDSFRRYGFSVRCLRD